MFKKLKNITRQLKKELATYQLVLKHPETPKLAKFFLGLAVGYLLLPFDLIPDFIPILGQLDDVVIIPILLYLAIWLTPKEVIEACRAQVNQQYST
ncbi:MAG TPA: YkvA family protein [Methylotenera sp.]|nr:YkvA family protein [Methylotenera sp.]HPH05887.1 YkvA family protein [Methylotenera sp.]HPN00669.1 YkvA family protein [Methylotenera sp.]